MHSFRKQLCSIIVFSLYYLLLKFLSTARHASLSAMVGLKKDVNNRDDRKTW